MAINFKLSNCPFCYGEHLNLYFTCANSSCVAFYFRPIGKTDTDKALSWNRFCNSEKEQIRFLAQFISKKNLMDNIILICFKCKSIEFEDIELELNKTVSGKFFSFTWPGKKCKTCDYRTIDPTTLEELEKMHGTNKN